MNFVTLSISKEMKHFLYLAIVAITLSSCANHSMKYDAEGMFESEEITVSAEATGKIIEFQVREGQEVTAGQEVGSIDSLQLYLTKLQLQSSAMSVVSNKPNISSQTAALMGQLVKLNKEEDRLKSMFADGAATQKQLDDIESQIIVTKAQLEALNVTLGNSSKSIDAQNASLEMQIAQIEDRLAKCHITVPVTGTVLTKYVNEGEFTSVGRPLFKVADLKNVLLRAYVTSSQLSNIKLGQSVKVFADFGGDNVHEYEGKIEWIAGKSEFTPKNIQTSDERENLVYAVKIAVHNDGFIKLGMYGGIRY